MNENTCIDSLKNNPLTPISHTIELDQNLEDEFLSKEDINALKMID